MLERKMILKIALTLVLALGLCWSALADKENLKQAAGAVNPDPVSEMGAAEACEYPVDAREAPAGEGAGAPPRGNLRSEFLHEEFEDAVPPAGWSADTTNIHDSTWTKAGVPFHVGTYSATVFWDSSLAWQDEWLKTPVMDLSTATEGLHVVFWWMMSYYWGVDPHDNYDMELWISTDGGTTFPTMLWTETDEPLFDTATDNFTWYEACIDLSAYRDNDVVLGWRYVGVDGAQASIDLVSVNDDIGRCCYGPALSCVDSVIECYCDTLHGTWSEGLNCTDSPCVGIYAVDPSDDMYTDPDVGGGHVHPTDTMTLWTADYYCGGMNQHHHERIMIKFDLSAYTGQQVDSAYLNIYRYFRCPMVPTTIAEFYHITQPWDEDTWNDMVHINHGASSWQTFTFGPLNGWQRIDIKNAVDDWLDGSVTNHGFVIQAHPYGEKCSKFYSKEYPAGLGPHLELYVATGCCNHDGIRGDADTSGSVNVGDVAYLVEYLFGDPPGPAPPCFEEADVDAMGSINVGDVAYLVSYLFGVPQGPAPLPCP